MPVETAKGYWWLLNIEPSLSLKPAQIRPKPLAKLYNSITEELESSYTLKVNTGCTAAFSTRPRIWFYFSTRIYLSLQAYAELHALSPLRGSISPWSNVSLLANGVKPPYAIKFVLGDRYSRFKNQGRGEGGEGKKRVRRGGGGEGGRGGWGRGERGRRGKGRGGWGRGKGEGEGGKGEGEEGGGGQKGRGSYCSRSAWTLKIHLPFTLDQPWAHLY